MSVSDQFGIDLVGVRFEDGWIIELMIIDDHQWDLAHRKMLIKKVYRYLKELRYDDYMWDLGLPETPNATYLIHLFCSHKPNEEGKHTLDVTNQLVTAKGGRFKMTILPEEEIAWLKDSQIVSFYDIWKADLNSAPIPTFLSLAPDLSNNDDQSPKKSHLPDPEEYFCSSCEQPHSWRLRERTEFYYTWSCTNDACDHSEDLIEDAAPAL